jgi:hemerythrin superfamily protein
MEIAMPAAKKTAAKKTAAKKTATRKTARASTTDALAVLTKDHKRVKKMFRDFEKLKESGAAGDKQALAEQICAELTLHAEVEEQIFYPAVRDAIDNEDLLNEAEVEHASAKDLIAQIRNGDPSDAIWSAKVSVLGEYVNHHVEEEENQMFRKAKKAKMDLEALGQEISSMKQSRQGTGAAASPAQSATRSVSAPPA